MYLHMYLIIIATVCKVTIYAEKLTTLALHPVNETIVYVCNKYVSFATKLKEINYFITN